MEFRQQFTRAAKAAALALVMACVVLAASAFAQSSGPSVKGSVLDEQTVGVPGARITVLRAGQPIAVAGTRDKDPIGTWEFGELTSGVDYTFLIEKSGFISQSRLIKFSGREPARLIFVLSRAAAPKTYKGELRSTLLVVLAYIVTLLVARWHHIAKPARELLREQLRLCRIRRATEAQGAPDILDTELKNLEADYARSTVFDWLLWSRGKENAGWVAVHEIERQIATYSAPPERVSVRLASVQYELRELGKRDETALAAADLITKELAGDGGSPERRNHLLADALRILYAERDAKFSSLMEWHTKSNWLVVTALIFVLALVGAAGHALLLLSGAVGGILSRLTRTLRRADIPLDYGASWTTLFLSPLLGAFSAWFGIALIVLARDLGVVGTVFAGIVWDQPWHPHALAMAVVLGFSERLFDSLTAAVERRALNEPEPGTPGQPAPSRVPAPPAPAPPPPAAPTQETVQPGAEVSLVDARLVKSNIREFHLQNDRGDKLDPIGLKLGDGKITFQAPAEPGKYTFTLNMSTEPKTIGKSFTVK